VDVDRLEDAGHPVVLLVHDERGAVQGLVGAADEGGADAEPLVQAQLAEVAQAVLDGEERHAALRDVGLVHADRLHPLPRREAAQPEVVADVHVAVLVDEVLGDRLLEEAGEAAYVGQVDRCWSAHGGRRYRPRARGPAAPDRVLRSPTHGTVHRQSQEAS